MTSSFTQIQRNSTGSTCDWSWRHCGSTHFMRAHSNAHLINQKWNSVVTLWVVELSGYWTRRSKLFENGHNPRMFMRYANSLALRIIIDDLSKISVRLQHPWLHYSSKRVATSGKIDLLFGIRLTTSRLNG